MLMLMKNANANANVAFFDKLTTYFCTIRIIKPTPSQINLIRNAKKSFFIIEKIQKYRKCPALLEIIRKCSLQYG